MTPDPKEPAEVLIRIIRKGAPPRLISLDECRNVRIGFDPGGRVFLFLDTDPDKVKLT